MRASDERKRFVTRLHFCEFGMRLKTDKTFIRRSTQFENLCRQTGLLVCLLLPVIANQACRQAAAPAREANPQATPHAPQTTVADKVKVRTEVGFASRQKLLEHYQKHGREFGGVSAEDYLRQAQTLRDRPAGKDVLEVVRADGVISRFDQTSGAFLAFNQDLTIRTYFKPNDGVNYFWRQSRR